jgi:hypothetical protein
MIKRSQVQVPGCRSVILFNLPLLIAAQFLDFPQLPVYHPSGFFKSIGPATPNKPFQAGDKLHVVLEGATFDPLFLVCSISSTSFSLSYSHLSSQASSN